MRGSHCIVSGCFQQLYFAFLGAVEGRSSQRPVIMMDAAACELDRLSIQKQPLLR